MRGTAVGPDPKKSGDSEVLLDNEKAGQSILKLLSFGSFEEYAACNFQVLQNSC